MQDKRCKACDNILDERDQLEIGARQFLPGFVSRVCHDCHNRLIAALLKNPEYLELISVIDEINVRTSYVPQDGSEMVRSVTRTNELRKDEIRLKIALNKFIANWVRAGGGEEEDRAH